jgi:Cu-processing system permease protein
MNTVLKISWYQLQDAIRGRWMVLYTILLAVATELMIQFGGEDTRLIASLMNLVLILIPLVSIVFGTMHVHHSRNFIELLLTQPVSRKALFGGLYIGIALPLSAGFAIGVGGPLLIHASTDSVQPNALIALMVTGTLLTMVFTALALVVALRSENRVRATGLALLLWVFFTLIYDGIVLLVSYSLSAYPLERAMIGVALLNPIDLGRIILLLQVDISALMGYTGAVFEQFFGSPLGLMMSGGALFAWIAASLLLARITFVRKDF